MIYRFMFLPFLYSLFISIPSLALERPPQFIALSFDNCAELDRWENLKAFTDEMNQNGPNVHFTFFVSGTNFIAQKNHNSYQGPRHKVGAANIDFSANDEEINQRLGFMHSLHDSGNELASHAIGHFDGRNWNHNDWMSELSRFSVLFLNAFTQAGFLDAKELTDHIKGFRAPYLSTSPALYPVLKELGYRYDTSNSGDRTLWPTQDKNDLWRFNLASLKIAETGIKTLSMDYNFYVRQAHGEHEIPKMAEAFQRQMLETYLNYFQENYYGNRAPLHIGHHFFPYQQGIYHLALQKFAREVCFLPEVRCVSNSELADFLDLAGASTLKSYQSGDFTKMPRN